MAYGLLTQALDTAKFLIAEEIGIDPQLPDTSPLGYEGIVIKFATRMIKLRICCR